MAREVLLIRHLPDENNLLIPGNNADLVFAEMPRARLIAAELSRTTRELRYTNLVMITSNKQRAVKTTHEVQRYLGDALPSTIMEDERIRELDQGDYILPVGYKAGDHFQPLQDAWSAFFKETFSNRNLMYRFGDPLSGENGSCKYSELKGHFRSFGENQVEFSIRFYEFVIDICERYMSQENILPVVVTHQAVTARFAELVKIAQKVKDGHITDIEVGAMPLLEWQQFEEINRGNDIFIGFGDATTFSLGNLHTLLNTLKLEILQLRAIGDKS